MTSYTLVDQQPDFIIVDKNPDVNFHDEGETGAGLFNQVKNDLAQEQLFLYTV